VNCETARDLLVLLNYGELSFEDEDALERHLDSCPACVAEKKSLEKLDAFLASDAAEVPPGLLARCRRDLSGRLLHEKAPSRPFFLHVWWQDLSSAAWLKPAAAVALLVVGFTGGKMVHPVQTQNVALAPVQRAVAQPVEERALAPEPETSAETPIAYQPVRQAEALSGESDLRVRNLLLAAVNDQDPALRVDSIDLLQKRCGDETVRKALLGALKGDPNSGVRLRALEALRPYSHSQDTRTVLANVVLNDTSPTIRAQAIDLLVQSRDPDVASTLQEVLRREENPYIRERSVHALRAMKASAGTF